MLDDSIQELKPLLQRMACGVSQASWSPIPWGFEPLILFLEWMQVEMHEEAYQDYIKRAEKGVQAMMQKQAGTWATWAADSYTTFTASYLPVWMNDVASNCDQLYEWIASN
jgi:hypothetical protein